MGTDGPLTYHGDNFSMYKNIKSPSGIHEINMVSFYFNLKNSRVSKALSRQAAFTNHLFSWGHFLSLGRGWCWGLSLAMGLSWGKISAWIFWKSQGLVWEIRIERRPRYVTVFSCRFLARYCGCKRWSSQAGKAVRLPTASFARETPSQPL